MVPSPSWNTFQKTTKRVKQFSKVSLQLQRRFCGQREGIEGAGRGQG